LGQQAGREGYSVLSLRLPRCLQERPTAQGDGRYGNVLAALAHTARIILDDWGRAQFDEPSRHDVLELLADRHGHRATIVPSQLPIEHWHEAIGDPPLADAMLDRWVHNAYKLSLQGDAMRKRFSTPHTAEPQA
jgi:DNA replication protein DnaC